MESPNIVPFDGALEEKDDLFATNYRSSFLRSGTPIVIDNGSLRCRAGWASEKLPFLEFPPIVGKPRVKTPEDPAYVGNDLKPYDYARLALRTPFDGNVVTHYDTQELIFDHIFSHLGIDTDSVKHPVVLTEPVGNPNYCRKVMSELLFECYSLPSVVYGIDGLFSWFGNSDAAASQDALVVATGHSTTHVLPLLGGRLQAKQVKRVSVGGAHMTDLTQKLLHLKYPNHRQFMTYERCQQVKEQHCYVAENYTEELKAFASNTDDGRSKGVTLQLPHATTATGGPSDEDKQRKEKWRFEAGQRLRKMQQEKREAKLREKQSELQVLEELRDSEATMTPQQFKKTLAVYDFQRREDVLAGITRLSAEIKKLSKKPEEAAPPPADDEIEEEEDPDRDYYLLDIPDDELTPDLRKEKKKQRIMKAARDGRRKAMAKRQLEKEIKENREREEEARRLQDPEGYLAAIRGRREEILQRKEKRRKTDEQTVGSGGRATAAKQRRFKAITEAAFDDGMNNEEADFGANDDDWNVYLMMANEPDELTEEENQELVRLQSILEKHDPSFVKSAADIAASSQLPTPELEHQIYLGVERIRIPEIVFQPSIIGHDQMGVSEAIFHVLSQFTAEQQAAIAKNIFVTGGPACFPGFRQRLEYDVRCIRPVGSEFRVLSAANPLLDAWRGAAKFASNAELMKSVAVSRAEYLEQGGDYLREHCASNMFLNLKLYS
eukprot:TRINITY_DN10081_c0_g2_i2.p1 TRINITY_DN10081_c0_g2~~TRINITY_DN10081_c0_g2_i2.p1  ORF type:complete len:729 (+),score=211.08 TRINITY_DN10081_c0_g2_i2:27-2189(+)